VPCRTIRGGSTGWGLPSVRSARTGRGDEPAATIGVAGPPEGAQGSREEVLSQM